MTPAGGGFLSFGILILTVEHDPLQFFGQAADFGFVRGVFDALQAEVKSLFRRVG